MLVGAQLGPTGPDSGKNCTLVSPLLNDAEFTLSVAKNVALFETVPILLFTSVKWRDRETKYRNKRSNFRLHRPSSHRKSESNYCRKLLEIEKEIVREVALGG